MKRIQKYDIKEISFTIFEYMHKGIFGVMRYFRTHGVCIHQQSNKIPSQL